MSTFRELFDEQDRDELVDALQARLNPLEARIRKLETSDRVTDATIQLDKLRTRARRLQDLMDRIVAESI